MVYSKRHTLLVMGLLCLGVWPCSGQENASLSGKPNILYIFTDDQSHRSVSCYEEARPWAKTPHIDKLADTGMRFTHCYTGAWCQPSRASALSGLLQHAVKTVKITKYPMASYDPEQLRFFPSVLRKNGYETACIGKWHLGEDVGHGRDWDYSVIWDRGGVRRNAGAYLTAPSSGPMGGIVSHSADTARIATPSWRWITSRQRRAPKNPGTFGFATEECTAPTRLPKGIRTHISDAPASRVPVDIFGPRPTKPEHLKNLTRWKKDGKGEPKGYDAAVKKYHKAVKSLDDGVGAVMQALKDSGQLKNTVIIFTSDQGFAWGQHGSQEKWMPYDANICAPLIFSAPGLVKPGTVCKEARQRG